MPLFIIPAIKIPAWYGPVIPNCALIGIPVQTYTVTITTASDQIGTAKLPADYPFITLCLDSANGNLQHIALHTSSLLSQSTSASLSKVYFRIQDPVHEPESALSELPDQALSDLPSPFIKLFDRDYPFFVEQL
ncbi:hypothetical protein [Methanosarcina horonobensis]|uniref:hypothetical protein n=1 Tax=Methanosarcina horonobensis TaxID=418008 RepID=UPI000A648520|nr:hypothetical protein [Methanosarcina horonobensis]